MNVRRTALAAIATAALATTAAVSLPATPAMAQPRRNPCNAIWAEIEAAIAMWDIYEGLLTAAQLSGDTNGAANYTIDVNNLSRSIDSMQHYANQRGC
jgi:hypothetical protein